MILFTFVVDSIMLTHLKNFLTRLRQAQPLITLRKLVCIQIFKHSFLAKQIEFGTNLRLFLYHTIIFKTYVPSTSFRDSSMPCHALHLCLIHLAHSMASFVWIGHIICFTVINSFIIIMPLQIIWSNISIFWYMI